MNRFTKVSSRQFYQSMLKDIHTTLMSKDEFHELLQDIHTVYEGIKLPKRATKHSSGYDLLSPISFDLEPDATIKIPIGIKCQLDNNKWLMIIPRSSMGFKYNARLVNQVGNIDSDYFDNKDNEGHIWVGLQNEGNRVWRVNAGDGIAQGIILNYCLTDDDNVIDEREGGFGSTDKK